MRVPPLRERAADIRPVLRLFVAQLSARHGSAPPRFTRSALHALVTYGWPGNVRELRNVVENACLLREGRPVRIVDLPAQIQKAAATPRSAVVDNGGGRLRLDLDRPLDELVARIITAVLRAEGGNRSRAAARLGISVRTIQRFLQRGASST